jgi:hypothetical protein
MYRVSFPQKKRKLSETQKISCHSLDVASTSVRLPTDTPGSPQSPVQVMVTPESPPNIKKQHRQSKIERGRRPLHGVECKGMNLSKLFDVM